MISLTKNDVIGIVAPAFSPDAEKLQNGVSYLRAKGFVVKEGKSVTAKKGYFAGDDNLRADDINNMFADKDVKAIICARGGWGSLRLLDLLDYNSISNNRKILVGYSDITSLQLALWKKIKLASLSGPMVAVEMAEGIGKDEESFLWRHLLYNNEKIVISFDKFSIKTLIDGECRGRLIGGCLSMVTAQLVTPYSPDYTDTILFIEDVNESLYKIDRQLSQLKYAGVLQGLAGVIIGQFVNYDDSEENLTALFSEYFTNYSYPVIYNFPYGHGGSMISLPMGAYCELTTKQKKLRFHSCYDN